MPWYFIYTLTSRVDDPPGCKLLGRVVGGEKRSRDDLGLLVDPVELRALVADNLRVLEPESNLLLGVLDGVGTVADVAADVDGVVATDGAGGRGQGVGGTEDGCERWGQICGRFVPEG